MDCGDCTLCCTTCAVDELDKPYNVVCNHCQNGCTIYEFRPKTCREFSCAYHQTENTNVAMRPDILGVVFEKLADDLMFGSVIANRKDFTHLNGQIAHFLKNDINTVLVKSGVPLVYHVDGASPESLLKRVYEIARKQWQLPHMTVT